jgi:hypothetical protein
MSVWHTGNNLPENNYIPSTSNMTDTNNNPNNQHTLESLLNDYNKISVFNNQIFTQCLFAIFSNNPEKCEIWSHAKFKALNMTPEPVEAKSYKEHREMKYNKGNTETKDDGWGDELSTSNNGWDDDSSSSNRGWGDKNNSRSYTNGGGRREGRQDDNWACKKCDYKTNFGSRSECFKCKEPRTDGGGARPRREARSDDWACTICDYKTNFGNRNECFKCKEPRGDSGSRISGQSRSYGNKRSFENEKKVSSGWSDDESDAKKPKIEETNATKNWDDEPATKVEAKTEVNTAVCGDEDW